MQVLKAHYRTAQENGHEQSGHRAHLSPCTPHLST